MKGTAGFAMLFVFVGILGCDSRFRQPPMTRVIPQFKQDCIEIESGAGRDGDQIDLDSQTIERISLRDHVESKLGLKTYGAIVLIIDARGGNAQELREVCVDLCKEHRLKFYEFHPGAFTGHEYLDR
jgi:hypothetical protein